MNQAVVWSGSAGNLHILGFDPTPECACPSYRQWRELLVGNWHALEFRSSRMNRKEPIEMPPRSCPKQTGLYIVGSPQSLICGVRGSREKVFSRRVDYADDLAV